MTIVRIVTVCSSYSCDKCDNRDSYYVLTCDNWQTIGIIVTVVTIAIIVTAVTVTTVVTCDSWDNRDSCDNC